MRQQTSTRLSKTTKTGRPKACPVLDLDGLYELAYAERLAVTVRR